MSSFTTFNQFDKRFAEFGKFSNDRSACPLFGLITCYNFMLNADISQKQHEQNLYAAITNYTTRSYPKYMLFEELLELTNKTLKPGDINATSPELLTSGIVGYEHIFKFGYEKNYCVLLLKNRNYIAILCKVSGGTEAFAVRDCHENTQRTFPNFEDLRQFLNTTYQFEEQTIVSGVRITEFENCEFLTIEAPFVLINIDTGLVDDTLEEEKGYVEEPQVIKSKENTETVKFSKEDEMAFALQMQLNEEDYVEFV